MPILSKTFSAPSRSRVDSSFRSRKPARPDDSLEPFAGFESTRAVRLSVGQRLHVLIQRTALVALVVGAVLYAVAAFLANEWLYLLSAGLVIGSVLGVVYPLLITASIDVTTLVPDAVTSTENIHLLVRLRQKKWLGPLKLLLPLSWLRVRLVVVRRTTAGYTPVILDAEQALLLKSCGQEITIKMPLPHLERGVYKLSHVQLGTCLPFGCAWALRSEQFTDRALTENTLVVLPPTCDMNGERLLAIDGVSVPMGMTFSNVVALTQSTSVRGIREFRIGDSLRHIHWPSSARLNKLLVREFESETLPMFDVYFDLTAPYVSRKQFELAVCLVHSLVHFGYQRDMLPELYLMPEVGSEEMEPLMFDLPVMKSPVETLSEILARVEPVANEQRASTVPIQTRRLLLAVTPAPHPGMNLTKESMELAPIKLLSLRQGSESGAEMTAVSLATIYGHEDMQTL